MSSKNNRTNKNNQILTVFVCAASIPLSMSVWIINSKYVAQNKGFDELLVISPTRWMVSCFISIVLAVYGYKRRSINLSGAIFGYMVAVVLTLSNYGFLAALFTFFITSSKATQVRPHLKKKIEADFQKDGQRNWIQVLCTSGMAAQLALFYLLDVGACERPIDFIKDYRASWFSIGVLGVFACSNGDTWASELGTIFTYSDPFLVSSWKKVPKGTNGGVSFIGTVCSTIGGFLVGFSQYCVIYWFSDEVLWAYGPPQWPIMLFGALAGLLGSFIDSVMGATLQYSGLDEKGRIVNNSSQAVKHICGRNILDNHSVNLISTVIMGLVMPTLSKILWPLF